MEKGRRKEKGAQSQVLHINIPLAVPNRVIVGFCKLPSTPPYRLVEPFTARQNSYRFIDGFTRELAGRTAVTVLCMSV